MKPSNFFALLLGVLVLFAVVVSLAFEVDDRRQVQAALDCEVETSFARAIMEQRQFGGTRIEDAVDLAKGQEPLYQIVIRAYQRPMFKTWEFQYDEVDKFANAEYMRCANEIKP